MFFKEPTISHTRGHCFKVDFTLAVSRTRRNHLGYRVVDAWNKLPPWVTNIHHQIQGAICSIVSVNIYTRTQKLSHNGSKCMQLFSSHS